MDLEEDLMIKNILWIFDMYIIYIQNFIAKTFNFHLIKTR